jgi:hypothetical protein
MGADEMPEPQGEDIQAFPDFETELILDRGYRLAFDQTGQVVIVSPPLYGQPPKSGG